jgi:hypothetical protein
VIVACRWPKACDYAGEGFDDVRGQLPRLGIQLQESMMPLLKESILGTNHRGYHIVMIDQLVCDAVS